METATYLIHDHPSVLDANPLLEELFDSVFTGGTLPNDSQYKVWYRTHRNIIGSMSEALIQRVENFL